MDVLEEACLLSIDYGELEAAQAGEISRLLTACMRGGFFHLSLERFGSELLEDWISTLHLMRQFYGEPLESKLAYYRGEGMSG
jgi:hypothetical protein